MKMVIILSISIPSWKFAFRRLSRLSYSFFGCLTACVISRDAKAVEFSAAFVSALLLPLPFPQNEVILLAANPPTNAEAADPRACFRFRSRIPGNITFFHSYLPFLLCMFFCCCCYFLLLIFSFSFLRSLHFPVSHAHFCDPQEERYTRK